MVQALNGNAIGPVANSPDSAGEQGQELNLGELLRALERRRRLALAVMAVSLFTGAALTFWARAFYPTFQGSFKLLVSDPINSEGQGTASSDDGIANVALQRSGRTNTSTLIEVLTSPLLLNPLEQKLGVEVGSVANRLTVAPSGGGRQGATEGVLVVSLLWPNPKEGEQILWRMSQEYLSYSLRQRQEKLNQGLEFLDQQAPELQQRVNVLQNTLAAFRQANGFVEPQEEAGAILVQRQGMEAQLKGLQLEQARLEGREASVRSGRLESSATAAPLAPASPGAQAEAPAAGRGGDPQGAAGMRGAAGGRANTPLEDLFAVETALTEAEANYTDATPQVQELRAKRDRLRPMLQRRQLGEIQADLAQNLSQQQEIWRQLNQLAKGFAINPQQIKQYDALQQQLEVAKDNLSSYIKARESFRLQVAQRTKPWRILSPPQFAPRPVAPSVPRNLALSLALGTAAGLGLALLRDRLDHVFHSAGELKESLSIPVLGVVPYLPGRENQTISATIAGLDGGERFAIKESLHNIFANFRMLRADKDLRLVAITSSTQGEGKTTTTAMFAQSLAQLGQRVLLWMRTCAAPCCTAIWARPTLRGCPACSRMPQSR